MKNERDVLASHLNAWMVQLAYSFQDPHYCYLAMEYCPGGDLRHLLTALGYLEEHEVRLYMAEMILAVFSLHSLGYIHRDLKPDNFLIDSKGHLKLTDFGLSKDGSHSNVTHRRFAQANSLPELSIASLQRRQVNLTTPKSSSISLSTMLTRPNTSLEAEETFSSKRKEEASNQAHIEADALVSPSHQGSSTFTSNNVSTPLFDPKAWQERQTKVETHFQGGNQGVEGGRCARVNSRENSTSSSPPSSSPPSSYPSVLTFPPPSSHHSPTQPLHAHSLSSQTSSSTSSSLHHTSSTASTAVKEPATSNLLISSSTSVHPSSDAPNRSYSVVGSPHYMSPEVLAGEHGYGTEVDWWSLGCIFFELVTGSPPFNGETPQQVFDNIIDWRTTMPQILSEYSDTVSPECLDFITKLFLCDAKERFNVKMGLARVFAHPFFKDFSIESIFNLEPPFIPQLKDDCDTTYFDIATEDRLGTLEEQEKEKTLFEEVGNHTPPSSSSTLTHTHPIQCPQTAPRRLTHSSRYYSPDDYWSEKNRHPQMTPSSHAPFDSYDSSLPNIASQSHKEHLMFLGLANISPAKRDVTMSSTKNYGRFTIQRTRALGTFTPLRRRAEAESPRRDIAGFTFQRKKSVRSFHHPYASLASSSELNHAQKHIGLDGECEEGMGYVSSSSLVTGGGGRRNSNLNASSLSVSGFSSTAAPSYDFSSDEAIMRYATARRSPDHFFNGSPGEGNFGSNDFSTLYITPRALNFDADANNNSKTSDLM